MIGRKKCWSTFLLTISAGQKSTKTALLHLPLIRVKNWNFCNRIVWETRSCHTVVSKPIPRKEWIAAQLFDLPSSITKLRVINSALRDCHAPLGLAGLSRVHLGHEMTDMELKHWVERHSMLMEENASGQKVNFRQRIKILTWVSQEAHQESLLRDKAWCVPSFSLYSSYP